jgi:hypothetical protein
MSDIQTSSPISFTSINNPKISLFPDGKFEQNDGLTLSKGTYFLGNKLLEMNYFEKDQFKQKLSYITTDFIIFSNIDHSTHVNVKVIKFAQTIETLRNSDVAGNKVVNALWIGDSLSKLEHVCLKSFVDQGHHVRLWVYNQKMANVPGGIELAAAETILPSSMIYTFKDHLAGFSDRFRWKMLSKLGGGWWIDTDIFCLKPLDFPEKDVISLEYYSKERFANASGIIKLSAESARWIDEYVSQIVVQTTWGCLGPEAVEKLVKSLNLSQFLKAPDILNPLEAYSMRGYLTGRLTLPARMSTAYTVHLFSYTWKMAKVNKDKDNKVYAELYRLSKICPK